MFFFSSVHLSRIHIFSLQYSVHIFCAIISKNATCYFLEVWHFFLQSILILSTQLDLGLPSYLFPSRFPTKTFYAPLLSPICATCPCHLFLLDLINWIIFSEEYKASSSLLYSLLHSTATYYLWNLLHVTLLEPGILRWLLNFRRISAPIMFINIRHPTCLSHMHLRRGCSHAGLLKDVWLCITSYSIIPPSKDSCRMPLVSQYCWQQQSSTYSTGKHQV